MHNVKIRDFIKNNISYVFVGVLSVFFTIVIFDSFKGQPAEIRTVNITGIIDNFIKSQASLNLPQEELRQKVKAFGTNLEKTLQDISKSKHLILMPSEAVIAGSQDITNEVITKLNLGHQAIKADSIN